jgi:hypothetical protein
MTKTVLSAALLLLAACSGRSDEVENGGLTAEDQAALDDASNMLDVEPDSLTAIEAPVGNGDAAATADANGL